MERRKEDPKMASSTSQETEMHDIQNKDEKDEQTVSLEGKTMKTGSPLIDNTPSENQQCPSIVQWPFTPQNVVDQSPLTSRSQIPNQSPSPVLISQWHFPPQQQQNLTNNHVQQGQLPLNYTQPAPPFWLPQRPGFPPFVPFGGGTEITFQAPAVGGGTASTNQPQVPNFSYPVGFPYPGFPGPCDAMSWWGQAQQAQQLCSLAFPGGYISSTPSLVPGSLTSPGQFLQRGVIRPPAKLSQKHQQLWDAQSAENVQLWNVINQLQSELTDHKNQLTRLEAEVSSLKPKVEEPPTVQNTGITSAVQPSKRGRPKKSVASVDGVHSPDSQPRARVRKPATFKVQTDPKAHLFEKVNLNKGEDKVKACQSTATLEQGNCENMSSNAHATSGNVETNGNNLIMPGLPNQAHQEFPRVELCGIGKNSDDKATNSKTAYSMHSQQVMGMNSKSNSAAFMGTSANGSLGWPGNITSDEHERNVSSIGSQGFYNGGSVIRDGGKLIPGWSFSLEDHDASEELEDVVLESAKDENDDMGDDASSGAEDIAGMKDKNDYNPDDAW
ncbi:hypothetical protein UlMin_038956 [Ulmus minor]